jgi:putative transposase
MDETTLGAVEKAYNNGKGAYGTRKIKRELMRRKIPIVMSRARIKRAMDILGLVSKYTIRRRKRQATVPADGMGAANLVARRFNDREPMEVVVSDLTYVRVGGQWAYICLLLDLGSRGVVGYAVGRGRDAGLTKAAFMAAGVDLRRIGVFHTDNGGEFKNGTVDGILDAFGIRRSLSKPGTPLGNAVAESMYSILKTEMGDRFGSMDELGVCLFEFVNWHNTTRLHGSLGYRPPSECGLPISCWASPAGYGPLVAGTQTRVAGNG